MPDQDWGVLSGNWRTTGALTGSWGGAGDTLAEHGFQILGGYCDSERLTDFDSGDSKRGTWGV